MNNDFKDLGYVIAFAVVNDKLGLVQFLQSNSVLVPDEVSDEKLIEITIQALSSGKEIQNSFLEWVKNKNFVEYKNVTGFDYTPISFPSTLSGSTTASTPTSTTSGSSSGGFWSGANFSSITSLLGTGASVFTSLSSSSDARKAAEAQANAQLALAQAQQSNNQTQLQIAQMQLAAAQAATAQAAPKNNTILYVVLGIAAVGLIGGVIYAVTKK